MSPSSAPCVRRTRTSSQPSWLPVWSTAPPSSNGSRPWLGTIVSWSIAQHDGSLTTARHVRRHDSSITTIGWCPSLYIAVTQPGGGWSSGRGSWLQRSRPHPYPGGVPINGSEAVVLLVLALILVGPERLPHYAEQLGRLVREFKRIASGAQERVRSELGPGFEDFDLTGLDPRQYDPRRIVREALAEDSSPGRGAASRPARSRTGAPPGGRAAPHPSTSGQAAGSSANGASPGPTQPGGHPTSRPMPAVPGASETAPFDDEAT